MTNINVNEKARCIELTKKDYAKACKYGTQEYIDLQEVRKAYPTFKVVEVTRKASLPKLSISIMVTDNFGRK